MLANVRIRYLALLSVDSNAASVENLSLTQRSVYMMLTEFGTIIAMECEQNSAERVTIRSLLTEGKFINAIKRYREETGADLRSAKEHVENIQKDLGL